MQKNKTAIIEGIVFTTLTGEQLKQKQKQYKTSKTLETISFNQDSKFIEKQYRGKTLLIEKTKTLRDIKDNENYLMFIENDGFLVLRGDMAVDCYFRLIDNAVAISGKVLEVLNYKY